MDNNDPDKTVVVERDTSERSTSPIGTIIVIVVLLVLAVLAYNLFTGNNGTTETQTGTGTETTAPTDQTTPAPTE